MLTFVGVENFAKESNRITKAPKEDMETVLTIVKEIFTELGYTGKKKARVEPTASAAIEDYISDEEEERQVVERKQPASVVSDLDAYRAKNSEELAHLQCVREAELETIDAKGKKELEVMQKLNAEQYQHAMRMNEASMTPETKLKVDEARQKLKFAEEAEALKAEEARRKMKADADEREKKQKADADAYAASKALEVQALQDAKEAADNAAMVAKEKRQKAAASGKIGAARRKANKAAALCEKTSNEYINCTPTMRRLMQLRLECVVEAAFPDAEKRRAYFAGIAAEIAEKAAAKVPSEPSPDAPAATESGVYRLEVKGANFKYYIGKSGDIESRMETHRSKGANGRREVLCLKAATSFERVGLMFPDGYDDLDDWERKETLLNMYEHGIDNVRGWRFCYRKHPKEHRKEILGNICSMKNSCYTCGRVGHFGYQCTETHYAQWAGGGLIEPVI